MNSPAWTFRRTASVLLVALLAFAGVAVSAAPAHATSYVEIDGIQYAVEPTDPDAGAQVITQIGSATEITIPESITTEGTTYTVRDILSSAFANRSLTSVTLPSTLTSIGSTAFRGNRLRTIDIPEGITEISSWTFADNDLAELSLPEGITTIGEHAFVNNIFLTSLELPSTLTTIGSFAFQVTSPENVTIPAGVTSIGQGALVSLADSLAVEFEGDAPTITPAGRDGTFGDVDDDTTLYFHSGAAGFTTPTWNGYTTTALFQVDFDSNGGSAVDAETVADGDTATEPTDPTRTDHAFTGWYTSPDLTTAYNFDTPITANTTLYAGWAETSITLDDVTYTFDPTDPEAEATVSSFSGTGSDVALPSTITSEERTYTVTTIGDAAFRGSALENVALPDTISDIGFMSFASTSLESIDLPDSVTSIDEYAFADAPLTDITLPASVTHIGEGAFDPVGASVLGSVVFLGDAPTITPGGPGTGSFGNPSQVTLYFHSGAAGFTTPTWNGYTTTALFQVDFDSNGGSAVDAETVADGDTATEPTDPTRTDHAFTGWYTSPDLTTAYNFDTPITANTTLYAGWALLPTADCLSGPTTVTAGETIELTLCAADVTTDIWLHSSPVELASGVTMTGEGATTVTVTIPASTTPGTHHIVAVDDATEDEFSRYAFTVDAAPVTPLPATGLDARTMAPLAAAALILTALGIILTRRPRRV